MISNTNLYNLGDGKTRAVRNALLGVSEPHWNIVNSSRAQLDREEIESGSVWSEEKRNRRYDAIMNNNAKMLSVEREKYRVNMDRAWYHFWRMELDEALESAGVSMRLSQ